MPNWLSEARKAAQRYGLDPDIFERQIRQESGGNPNARSPAGALGIAQIMPATARGWGVNPLDPHAALNAAASHMASDVRKYGSYENALRAYNAGPGAIEKSKSYAETNNYVRTILGGQTPKALTRPTGGGGSSDSSGASSTTTTTTPGVDNRAARAQLIQSFLSGHNRNPLTFALQARELRNVAPTTATETTRIPGSTGGGGGGATPASGSGNFKITGPNPGRLKPELVSFAKKVAGVYGRTLTGMDGSTHSKFTVNGNVSEHYSGNATDIPATGAALIAEGRAALIAAGMPRSQAMKQTGGLFNVGNHQVIFNTHEGGDHTNHLHISTHAR